MHFKPVHRVFLAFLLLSPVLSGFTQELIQVPDTLIREPLPVQIPLVQLPENQSDTLTVQPDSLGQAPVSQDVVDAPIDYQAVDSMEIDPVNKKVYLYGEALVTYKNIRLEAAFIEFDMNTKEVYAVGVADSIGNITGSPVFAEGNETFECKTLRYNFKTKKGYILQVISQQEGGYLHSDKTKRQPDGEIHLKDGKYTSCEADDPHYYVGLTKAKVLARNKIVSGPAYLVIEDVPLPAVLPFGYFPNKKGQASGILIPRYGEEVNRGFFLQNGGYYFALGKHFDLQLTGDIYTKGTWGIRAGSQYIKRYKFSGNIDLRFYRNVTGDKDLGDFAAGRDYSIFWSHRQDPKASPNSTFSANVSMSSSSFDRNHTFSSESYLTNTKSSSISFSRRWPGSPFNFSGSFNHQQNSLNKSVNLSLPKLAFNMSRIYPFRGKNSSGSRWYDNIEFSYSSRLENSILTNDTAFLTSRMFDNMRNGFQHSIPVSTVFRPFNNFTISPSMSYEGILYTESLKTFWDADYYNAETNTYGRVVTDTVPGLRYAHSVQPNISMSLNPRLYGMYQFKNPDSRIVAVRHVMQPSVSVSLVPDMRGILPNYYDTVQTDAAGTRYQVYSQFQGFVFGTPAGAGGKSGFISLSLNNNVEMKVRTPKDTASQEKKVKLLESFNFTTSYNIFADSLNWSPVNINGRTNLFNKININFGGTMDMYAQDKKGTRINRFEWTENRKLGRLTRAFLSLDMSLNSASPASAPSQAGPAARGMGAPPQGEMPEEAKPLPQAMAGQYADFSIPWNLSVRYNLNYSKSVQGSSVAQTLSFNGNLSLTPKWKISFGSGYDFTGRKLTYTTVNLHRDLHCWEMSFSWIPIGYHQSYAFQINVLSAVLRDLKYEKRKSWYDKTTNF